MKILEIFKKDIEDLKSKTYYVVECPYCHQKLLAERKEFEYIPFEPQKTSEKITQLLELDKKIQYLDNTIDITKSADPAKDQFNIRMCPRCGYRNIMHSRDEFNHLERLSWDCEKIK